MSKVSTPRRASSLVTFALLFALSNGQSITGQSENGDAIMSIEFMPLNSPSPSTAAVSEDAAIGTAFGFIRVHGVAASGPRSLVVCGLDNRTVFGLVNATPGPDAEYTLRVVQALDRELQSMYSVRVTCRDDDQRQASLEILVNVVDVNDNPPVFDRAVYTFSVPEESPPGYLIGMVRAADLDASQNAVTYSMAMSDKITIDSQTGRMRTFTQLDRETRPQVQVLVFASDGIHRAQARVIVNIMDVNDNPPFFQQAMFTFNLPENMPVGSIIGTVSAIDMDVGTNAEITYYMGTNSTFPVAVDPFTGQLLVQTTFDRELSDRYDLSIIASDHGTPPLHERARLVLNILDVNDNAPRSLVDSYQFVVIEGVPAGTTIGRVYFADRDTGENGRVTLTIQPPSDLFTTDGQALKATSTLDSLGTHNVTIVATDHGTPPHSSAPVMVTVQVINTVN